MLLLFCRHARIPGCSDVAIGTRMKSDLVLILPDPRYLRRRHNFNGHDFVGVSIPVQIELFVHGKRTNLGMRLAGGRSASGHCRKSDSAQDGGRGRESGGRDEGASGRGRGADANGRTRGSQPVAGECVECVRSW